MTAFYFQRIYWNERPNWVVVYSPLIQLMWLTRLRDAADKWKRTLQNSVFRSQQRLSTASTMSTASSNQTRASSIATATSSSTTKMSSSLHVLKWPDHDPKTISTQTRSSEHYQKLTDQNRGLPSHLVTEKTRARLVLKFIDIEFCTQILYLL